jgi:hypothetical protein
MRVEETRCEAPAQEKAVWTAIGERRGRRVSSRMRRNRILW